MGAMDFIFKSLVREDGCAQLRNVGEKREGRVYKSAVLS